MSILQIKITLRELKPPIWRRIQVEDTMTFRELHEVIQLLMDWEDSHLHNFEVDGTSRGYRKRTYIGLSEDNPFGAAPDFIEKEEQLKDWFKKGDTALYTYDFGDNWEHHLKVEDVLEPEPDAYYPSCTAARRLAPMEDSRMEVLMEMDENGKWIVEEDPRPKVLQQELNEELKEWSEKHR